MSEDSKPDIHEIVDCKFTREELNIMNNVLVKLSKDKLTMDEMKHIGTVWDSVQKHLGMENTSELRGDHKLEMDFEKMMKDKETAMSPVVEEDKVDDKVDDLVSESGSDSKEE